jgi:tRNA (guanine-N7-)-methyltransferase
VKFFPAQPERITGDVLEIGPGRGDFVFAEAKDHPDQQFVVVELGKKRYAKLVERLQKRALTNVLVVFGDARVVLPKYFQDATFSSIVVLFPDPWPKRKHAFNRLLQPVFLVELARLLKPGGHLYLKSDVESYVQWVREQVAQLPQYRIVDNRWPWSSVDGQDGKTLSLFADRQLGYGYGIHSLCLERV